MEEIMEVITWTQINIHAKPIGLLNVKGFYDGIVHWVDHATTEGFIRPAHRALLCSHSSLDVLLEQMAQVQYVDLSTQL